MPIDPRKRQKKLERQRAKQRDIPAESCTEQFTFGKDGKPFFVAGPYDSRTRCEQVMRTLEKRCGPKGYHFLMPVGEEELEDLQLLGEPDDLELPDER